MTEAQRRKAAHVYYCGWVMGKARKYGVDFIPVLDDDGNYTDRIELALSPDLSITLVIPEPPPHWRTP